MRDERVQYVAARLQEQGLPAAEAVAAAEQAQREVEQRKEKS